MMLSASEWFSLLVVAVIVAAIFIGVRRHG
jgi:hypothetical protein